MEPVDVLPVAVGRMLGYLLDERVVPEPEDLLEFLRFVRDS